MPNSKDYFDVRAKIDAVRKKMKGLGSDFHWIAIHPDVRGALRAAFQHISSSELSNLIGFSSNTIERWKVERVQTDDLKLKVLSLKSGGQKNVSMTILVRPEICRLVEKSSATIVSREFEIGRSSVRRWVEAGWADVSTAELEIRQKPSQIPAALKANESQAIAEDGEAKQLALFVERHKGKTRKKYSPSEKRLIISLVERFGSKAVKDAFGVSYDTIARLKRRQENELERKKRIPLRYIPVVDLMRKHPGMGPMQIRDYIRRHLGLSMGVNSIRKVMEQNGWVPPFAKRSHVKDGFQFYEAARKNYLWHMDFKHQWINKCKAFILFVQDDYSRFVVGDKVCDGEKVDAVLAAVEEAIRIHGKPEVIMTDGGSAFFSWRGSSKFTRFLEDYGIEQLIASTPNVNGKLENLNAQVEKELLTVQSFASIGHFHKELSKWIAFYNFSRIHQGLDSNQVPADRYFPGAKQWYGDVNQTTEQQSLIAETMATLLMELKKPK